MSSIRMPHFLRNSCKTQWEAEPKRVMATFFPFSSAGVLMSGRTISLCRPVLRGEAITTVSAPLNDERMTESPPPTENWTMFESYVIALDQRQEICSESNLILGKSL